MTRATARISVYGNGVPSPAINAPRQPLVTLGSAVVQSQPPQTGFSFPGTSRRIALSNTASSTYWCCPGPDHQVWVTQANLDGTTGKVWSISTDGLDTVNEFDISGSSKANAICAGPDGNLWIADANHAVIRVGTDGSMTTFNTTGHLNTPIGICAAPDGNLYATGTAGGVIRVGTDGTITPLFNPSTSPVWITAATDGQSLWAITPTQAILLSFGGTVLKSFTIPTITGASHGAPSGCIGPDGNLWVCGLDPASIPDFPAYQSLVSRVTPDGEVTTFTATIEMTEAGAGPNFFGICTGSGGDLWLGDNYTNIWKLTPDGTFTSFPGPGTGTGICSANDGALWVCDYAGGIVVFPFDVINPNFNIAQGRLSVPHMPTSDPHVAGMVWNHSGVMTVSAGMTRATAPIALSVNGVPSGVVSVQRQPIVTLGSGVIPAQPPQTGFTFPGTLRKVELSGVGQSTYWLCTGPDHNVYITETLTDSSYSAVWVVSPEGNVVTHYDCPTNPSNFGGICAGADGNLWITDAYKNQGVWRMTPAGSFTFIPLSNYGGGGVGVGSICTDYNGKIWATSGSSHTSRINVDGTVELNVAAGGNWITLGPDGRIWLAAFQEITPIDVNTGAVGTSISMPNSGSFTGMCVGPDNKMWVANLRADGTDQGSKVWRVDVFTGETDSVVLDSDIGTELQGICTGAGGDLWVSSIAGAAPLFKVTPDLQVTPFTDLEGIAPVGIISGPDGSLWQADYNGYVVIWPFDVIAPGAVVSSGRMSVPNIPTANPHVVGEVWSNSGILTVSAG